MTVPARLNRLLAKDGKCFDVAIDHGFFGEISFLPGIENMARAVETVANAFHGPRANQVSTPEAVQTRAVFAKRPKPARCCFQGQGGFGLPERESAKREGLRGKQLSASSFYPRSGTWLFGFLVTSSRTQQALFYCFEGSSQKTGLKSS